MNIIIKSLFFILLFSFSAFAESKGHMVIVGGGNMRGTEIVPTFKQLAGENTKLVIIPTAKPDNKLKPMFNNLASIQRWIDAGFTEIHILHTRSKEVANQESFYKTLKTAGAVWITGGRQWRLAQAYLGTKVQEEIYNVYKRGGVIGGSSAGASIFGSFLVRGSSKHGNKVMIGDYKQGFGYLPNMAIDQHVIERNRQYDMLKVLPKNPGLRAIGIDKNTALIISEESARVIGESVILQYYNPAPWKFLPVPFKTLDEHSELSTKDFL